MYIRGHDGLFSDNYSKIIIIIFFYSSFSKIKKKNIVLQNFDRDIKISIIHLLSCVGSICFNILAIGCVF